MNIAKSSTGKEHIKATIEQVLEACDLEHLIAGGGYTSAGAVFSTLLSKPSHISVIDEMGMYLEASKSNANVNAKEANKVLMEAIGRLDGILRPTNYSTMTLGDAAKKSTENRKVVCPAMVIVGLTTPSTFYENISNEQIKDGFLGRFIIYSSNMPRVKSRELGFISVPECIIQWNDSIKARFEDRGNLINTMLNDPAATPDALTITFSSGALEVFSKFEDEMIVLADSLDAEDLDGACGRTKEFAMRISLIVALSRSPDTEEIIISDAQWSVDYMRLIITQTIECFRKHIFASNNEKERSEILESIRKIGDNGITSREMKRKKPFSAHTGRQLDSLLSELQAAGLVDNRNISKDLGKTGRPRIAWIALDPDYEEE